MTPLNKNSMIDTTDPNAIILEDPSKRQPRLHREYYSSSSSDCSSVAFSEDDQVIEFERSTEGCPRQLWFSSNDLKGFREHCHYTIQVSMSGRLNAYADLCDRGLEELARAGNLQSRNRRKYARSVVLEEQKRQREMNTFEPETISELYSKATLRSRMIAEAKGKGDVFCASR